MRHAEERIYREAQYILEHHATVRDAARVFHAGKSTVHQDVTTRLMQLNPALYAKVRAVLDVNLAERHVRGGQATREKYLGIGNR
ncbi:MAG: sporulation transcriptional regulator SpoIIID [Clostridiales bacterium]|nr:sporulation transcriptional regulator SpoIIID [Clostridiales bacterium]